MRLRKRYTPAPQKQDAMMRTTRLLAVAAAVGGLLLAAALAWALLSSDERLVAIAVVDRGIVEEIVREEARAHVHDRYTITAPVTGYRPRLEWHVGDAVRGGDLLLQLQPAASGLPDMEARVATEARVAGARAALRAAQTNANAARARVDLAEKEQARLQDLFDAGDVSRQLLDQAEYALRDANAHLRSAEFAIDIARYELDAAREQLARAGRESAEEVAVRAPAAGIVLAVPEHDEGAVRAGEALLEIGDPASLEVHADVRTADAVRLDPGMPVRIIDWGGEHPLQGRVRLVEPAAFTKVSAPGIEEQRARVVIDIVSPRDQWRRLGDGYRVDVKFLLWRGEDVLRVPVAALFRQEDRWMVFRVRDGRAFGTPVAIGHRGEHHAEVLDGLEPGDRVVLHPDSEIAEGARVEAR